jgi:hypothetical protein
MSSTPETSLPEVSVPETFEHEGETYTLVDRTTLVWGVQHDLDHLGTLERRLPEDPATESTWVNNPADTRDSVTSEPFATWQEALVDLIVNL